jgi:hypothetical protein
MTAKASRARSIIFFMYVSSLPVGRRIFNLVQHSQWPLAGTSAMQRVVAGG